MQKILIILLLTLNLFGSDKFNVKKAQEVTYEVKVTTLDNKVSSGTAIALSSDGKLITAYHNIDAYKIITIVDFRGKEYSATVGKISVKNDLAYLYIDVTQIPYVKLANDLSLGDDVYMLSYDNLLLKGIISQNKINTVIVNVEINKGASGGGVFNNKNELIAILLNKDLLDKTSLAVKPSLFNSIAESFKYKKELLKIGSNNYNNSYCYNKEELKIWEKYAKSDDIAIQELHAIFIGLCKKVEKRDLTTESAQFIFESARSRLIGNE